MVNVNELLQSGTNFVKGNAGLLSVGAGALAVGGVVGASTVLAAKSVNKRKKRKTKKANGKSRRRPSRRASCHRKRRSRRTPRTAGRGKDTSSRRIRYTKKGQPYIIMASGKARFIKKSGAKRSHKRKGGRY